MHNKSFTFNYLATMKSQGIYLNLSEPFYLACQNENEEIAKYLLNSSEEYLPTESVAIALRNMIRNDKLKMIHTKTFRTSINGCEKNA